MAALCLTESFSVTSAKQLKKSWKTSDIALWRIPTGRRHHPLYYSGNGIEIATTTVLPPVGVWWTTTFLRFFSTQSQRLEYNLVPFRGRRLGSRMFSSQWTFRLGWPLGRVLFGSIRIESRHGRKWKKLMHCFINGKHWIMASTDRSNYLHYF